MVTRRRKKHVNISKIKAKMVLEDHEEEDDEMDEEDDVEQHHPPHPHLVELGEHRGRASCVSRYGAVLLCSLRPTQQSSPSFYLTFLSIILNHVFSTSSGSYDEINQ